MAGGGITTAAAAPSPKGVGAKGSPKTDGRPTDYIWCIGFAFTMYFAGNAMGWKPSTKKETEAFLLTLNVFSFETSTDEPKTWLPVFLVYYLVAIIALSSITGSLWCVMKALHPKTPSTHLYVQAKDSITNFVLLGAYQTMWDVLACLGYTKLTTGNLDPPRLLRDVVLWQLAFELSWYTQHRLMHDNKFLWLHGHSYHHRWKIPEHMIGVTNFAFDHIVEPWVTMSSSLFPVLVFPINFHVSKIMGFGYMIFAVLVHWDHFTLSRYHLNHHYLVTKNYGSHWPIFDMFFDTYQWEPFEPKNRYE